MYISSTKNILDIKKGRNMKRFISILMIICLCTAAIFADETGDEYDDQKDQHYSSDNKSKH